MLATDLGLNFQGIVSSDPDALDALSEMTGALPESLTCNAIRYEDEAWRLRDQLLSKSLINRTAVRLCRACIADDIAGQSRPEVAAYGRVTWQIIPIRTCPIHCRPIVTAFERSSPAYDHDFSLLVELLLKKSAALSNAEAPRALSEFERYLLDRLKNAGTNSTPWLDSLEFMAVAKLCEIVGAVRLRGLRPNIRKMRDEDWHAAGAAGFEIVRSGKAGLRAWLSQLDASFPYTRSGNETAQAVFGDFYMWLNFRSPDHYFNPIRDVVRTHIIETMPVAAGEIVLGEVVEKRSIHSIRSASRDHAIHHKRLRKILDAAGLIPADMRDANDNRIRFSAEAADVVIFEEKDAISFRAVRGYINADRVQTKLLADNGFIKPTSTSKGDNQPRYTKTGLDAFLQLLLLNAQSVASPPSGAYTIPAAAKRANCSAAEIVRLILDGKLAWTGRLKSERGYTSALVDLDEVKSHVHAAPVGGLTARALEKRLRYSTRVITALIDHGQLPTVTVVNPINRCPMRIVKFEDIEAFERKFVHLQEAARIYGRHFNAIKAELVAKGVKAALDPTVFQATFYLRSDVERVFGPGVRPASGCIDQD